RPRSPEEEITRQPARTSLSRIIPIFPALPGRKLNHDNRAVTHLGARRGILLADSAMPFVVCAKAEPAALIIDLTHGLASEVRNRNVSGLIRLFRSRTGKGSADDLQFVRQRFARRSRCTFALHGRRDVVRSIVLNVWGDTPVVEDLVCDLLENGRCHFATMMCTNWLVDHDDHGDGGIGHGSETRKGSD